ncbi:hypothetical protein ES705_38944 [subsurface metagenome]
MFQFVKQLDIKIMGKIKIIKQLIKFVKPIVERFPRIAMAYRHLRDKRYVMDEPKETPMGFKLIGNRSMEEGTFEREEVVIVEKCLRKADVFVNIGANIGYYCCIALSQGKHTIAFEPIELNLRYLYKNIKANKWENGIEIFSIALSNKIGLIEIFGGGTGASLIKGWAGIPEYDVRLIPTSTMDNILNNRIKNKKCFILADIEGAEKSMLEGAKSFLESDTKHIWMVEISIGEHQPKGIIVNPELFSTFQLFWDSGYEAWTASNRPRLVELEEIMLICKSGRDTLHTHNFLFIEAGKKSEILDA